MSFHTDAPLVTISIVSLAEIRRKKKKKKKKDKRIGGLKERV